MNERLKELRKTLKLTQKEFGVKIGVTNFTISDIEKGKRVLTERNLNSICEKFNVNKEWLANGIGEMFLPQLPEDDFSRLLSEIEESDDEFIKKFLEIYWQLDDIGKKIIMDLAESLLRNQKNKRYYDLLFFIFGRI